MMASIARGVAWDMALAILQLRGYTGPTHGKNLPVKRGSGQALVFWTGLAVYALSFLLHGVGVIPFSGGGSSSPMRGYLCAVNAAFFPLYLLVANFASPKLNANEIVGLVAALIGGLINPLFWITVVHVVRNRQDTVATLRLVLVVMFLCCGIAFYALGIVPREGFLLWVLGILLVVASAEVAQLLRLPS
jgi:hypothetical protein